MAIVNRWVRGLIGFENRMMSGAMYGVYSNKLWRDVKARKAKIEKKERRKEEPETDQEVGARGVLLDKTLESHGVPLLLLPSTEYGVW